MNHGVGAEGLLAAQSALTGSADNYGNDPRCAVYSRKAIYIEFDIFEYE